MPSLHLLSRIHFLERDGAAALDALARALAVAPDSGPLLFGRGVVRASLGHIEQALADFDAVLRRDPRHDEAHNNRGNALLALRRPEEALEAYSTAAALNAANADAHYNAGVVIEHFGNAGLAERFLRAATALTPGNAQFRQALAECAPARPGDDNLLAMEQLLAASPPPEARLRLHFGLGKAYGDLGEAEAAFRHYAEGNALRRTALGYDETETLRLLRPPRQFPTRGSGTRSTAPGTPVPIFILGMPRSGSTLVEQVLSRHPKVAPGGETGLFPRLSDTLLVGESGDVSTDAMLSLPEERSRRLGADYLEALGRRHPGAAFITDKTPVNFRYIPLIRAALPGAVIIHTLRDARDTCLSCFFRLFAGESQPFSYDLGELARYYAAYRDLMAHWRQTLPGGSLLDIAYERLVADLSGETRRLLEYCGLPWSERCLAPQEGLRFVASDARVLKPVYAGSIGRWRHYAAFLDALAPLSEEFAPRADAIS